VERAAVRLAVVTQEREPLWDADRPVKGGAAAAATPPRRQGADLLERGGRGELQLPSADTYPPPRESPAWQNAAPDRLNNLAATHFASWWWGWIDGQSQQSQHGRRCTIPNPTEGEEEMHRQSPPLTCGPRREGLGEGEDLRLRLLGGDAPAHADVAAREAAVPPPAHRARWLCRIDPQKKVPVRYERDGRMGSALNGRVTHVSWTHQRRQAPPRSGTPRPRRQGRGKGYLFVMFASHRMVDLLRHWSDVCRLDPRMGEWPTARARKKRTRRLPGCHTCPWSVVHAVLGSGWWSEVRIRIPIPCANRLEMEMSTVCTPVRCCRQAPLFFFYW
jgi:hypothetical protein